MPRTPDDGAGFRLVAAVRRYPLIAYCVLLAAASWPVMVGAPYAVFLVGPSVCAFVVVGITHGRRGVRELWGRVLRWRVPARYYLVALVGLGAYLFATTYTVVLLVRPGQLVGWSLTSALLTSAVNIVPVLVMVGLGEEFGWRGFALPRLQDRHGPLVASLVVGLLWAVWHWPLRIVEGGVSTDLVWTTVGITAASCLYTWMFNSTGGSVLLVALMHAAENTWVGVPFEVVFDAGSPGFRDAFAVREIAFVVLVVVVVLVTRGRLGLRRHAPVRST